GKMKTGWKRIDGNKYYFSTTGSGKEYGAAVTGWQTIDGYTYYFSSTGVVQTGWQTISGSKYYFSSSGKMQTGWQTIDGSKYYFSSSGVMQTGWVTISGGAYYFNSSGILQTNGIVGSASEGYGQVDSSGKRTASVETSAVAMISKAQSYSSSTNWLLMVNSSTNRVGVFYGSYGNWQLKYYFVCATGKSSSPTVKGSYTVLAKGKAFGTTYTCWYYTQFYGNYLFHSILYEPGSMTQVQESGLGTNASHGCVRLSLTDAKWIYDNIPIGTKVISY
ncbi:MAG: L,D-transpeptidase family protein, partial [Lachnospiraceae bacterium]|nr:L,D-transpeptidase family protein [Lachnospiraceae bacterium]